MIIELEFHQQGNIPRLLIVMISYMEGQEYIMRISWKWRKFHGIILNNPLP